ncbi:hypothetical protein OAL58_06905 [Verrucomicrobia bacterium]|nr:hypothetical protein [Verrucomicrobiota bacterium]
MRVIFLLNLIMGLFLLQGCGGDNQAKNQAKDQTKDQAKDQAKEYPDEYTLASDVDIDCKVGNYMTFDCGKLVYASNTVAEHYKFIHFKVLETTGDSLSLKVLHNGQKLFESGPKDGLVEYTLSLNGKNIRDISITIGENRKRDVGLFSSPYANGMRGRLNITLIK